MAFSAPVPTAAQTPFRDGLDGYGVAADIKVQRTVPTQEYVTRGGYSTAITGETAKVLSYRIDEIMRQLGGTKTYDRMLTDPEITKCFTVIKVSTLSDGITFNPAVSEQDSRYAKAKEYSDYCVRACSNPITPLRDTMEQMMDALVYGHKIAEITYELKIDGPDAGFYHVKYIKVKPQKSVAFVVDRFMNVLGFKAAAETSGPDGKFKIIPRDKFMVMTFRAKDDDPRGTSILRSCYNAWHLKMLMWPEYLRWLMQCAIPGIIGITSETNDQKNYVMNADGTVATDASGNQIAIPSTSQLADALAQMRNATVAAVPFGTTIEQINNNVSSEPFKTARDVLNEEMEMALLLQVLATSDSAHNTRAASETHMTVQDTLVYFIKGILADVIQRDIVKNLVFYRYGAEALDLLPKVSLGDTERRDWAIDGVAAGTMYKDGLLKDSQLPGIYRQLSLEQPAPGDKGLNLAQIAAQPAAPANTTPAAKKKGPTPAGTGGVAGGTGPTKPAKKAGGTS